MLRDRLPQAENYIHRNHNRRIWKRLVGALACVVVFCTTYALILPAITLEKQCPLEEHTHAESCYEQVPGHTHTEACYTTQRVLTCGLAETDAHVHETECYESQLVCDQEVSETHTHTETCYASVLVCAVSETDGHRHTENCYEQQPVLTCGLEETPDTQVLICGKEEHVHSAACTQNDSVNEGIILLNDDSQSLPNTKLSGAGTEYKPETDLFTTKVRIDFQFTTETGKPTAGTAYTYTYPKGIVVPDDVVNKAPQKLMDGDKDAGTYQFVKNEDGTYSVQIIFNQTYITESGNTVTGYVQFEGSFSKEDMNEKGDIVVGGDGAVVLVPGEDIAYPKDETESYNIDVSKSGNWVQDGDKLVYTVYIRTTKGTPDPIEFKDSITVPDGLTLGEPIVTVERGCRYWHNENYSFYDNTWTLLEANPVCSNGTITMSLGKLGVEPAKDTNGQDCIKQDVYKITYTYPIADQTVASVSPENNVTVRAEDNTKGQTVTDTDKTTVPVNKDFSYTLNKSGAVASDKPGYIKWTVTVNSNKVNIAGAELTDKMLGLVEDIAKDIVVSPANGANINKDDSGKITGITFSEIESGVNKNKYTITYYTPVEESWDGTTVTNTAKLDPKPNETGDEKEVPASVTVSGVQLNKWGAYDGANNKINWTITVNSGNLDIAGATLTDDMFSDLTDSDFTIEPPTGYSFKVEGGKITGITFEGGEDGKNTQCYTIKYSTDVTSNNDGTLSPVTNTATLLPGDGKEGTPIGSESTVTPEEVQLQKEGSYDWNGKINWTITVNEGHRNIAGAELTDEMFGELTENSLIIKDGNWTEVPAGSGQYTIHKDENGKVLKITFNGIGDTEVNTNQYIITYSTDALREWENKTVRNEAKLTLGEKEIPAEKDVTVPGEGSVSKSAGTAEVSEDGNTLTIPWTVTLTVPKGGLPAGTTIVDDVTKNQSGGTNVNQWMTRSQITAWATNLTWTDNSGNAVGGTNTYNPPPEQVTFLASNGNTYTYKQISEFKAPAEEGSVNFEELTYTLFTIYFPEGLVPPDGATKLTFTYDTTANLGATQIGGNKYYNYVQVGSKETSADYTYYKPGVVKTDGNGNTDKTSVNNEGVLTWKIKATVGSGNKKLTLIDTLPGGVTLSSLQLTGWGNLNMELSVNDRGITGTDSTNQYTVSGSYKEDTITLEIVPQMDGNTIQTGAEFTLIVTCTVNGAENQTESKTLTNTAKMELDGGEIGSSSQTQEWTYKKEEVVTKVVDKSGDWDNTNRIMDYTVILNPEGKDLLDGSDTLTLVDTMTYWNQFTLYNNPFTGTYNIDAALIQSSVKLYTAVWDETQGKWVAREPVTGWSWTYEAKTGENDWDKHNATNTITATGIPDGMPLMFQYAYRITSNAPDEQNGQKVYFDLSFSNKAELVGTGYSGDHSSSGTKWEHSSDSAGVTTDKSYTFYKVEAGNYNVSLAGAVFSVYKYDVSSSGYDEKPVKTYTTNKSGSFRITREEKDASGNVAFSYATNTLYKVIETAPPKGYKLPDKVETFYFYFSSTADSEPALPADLPSDAVDLSNEAKTVYVENIKNTTEITVEKKWKDANNNDINGIKGGTISFDLYQIASITPPGGGGSGEGETGTTTGVSYVAKCNTSIITGTFSDVAVGDTVKVSVNYTWQASSYRVAPSEWSGVSDGTGEYANNGYTYEYTCKIMSSPISFKTGDQEGSIQSIHCTLVEAGTSSDPDSSGSGDGEETTDPTPAEPTGTYINTYTISNTDGWTWSKDDLPLTGTDKDNNTIYYTYYVVEHSGTNYSTSYENNGGISSGTITIKNTESDTPVYELPETGGPGTTLYSAGGLLLMAAAGRLLLHKRKKRRKEDSASS